MKIFGCLPEPQLARLLAHQGSHPGLGGYFGVGSARPLPGICKLPRC